jgi:hypothetical protein
MNKYQVWTKYLPSDEPAEILAEFNKLKDVSNFLGITIPQVRSRIRPLIDGKIGNVWHFSNNNGYYQIIKNNSK